MNYSEKLKDPRWQRKRLEVLSRDNFRCDLCRRDTKTLHVHHRYYTRGLEPWEYPDQVYRTLCEDCHSLIHLKLTPLEETLLVIVFAFYDNKVDVDRFIHNIFSIVKEAKSNG